MEKTFNFLFLIPSRCVMNTEQTLMVDEAGTERSWRPKYHKWTVHRTGECDKYTGYPLHRENRGNGQNNSVRENTGNLEILPKHREFDLLKM